jgi:hypothetical protein
VAVAHQREGCAGLVGQLEERAGGVLVEHSGLVDHQECPVVEPGRGR